MSLSLLLLAAPPADSCNNARTQLAMNMCAQREFERADYAMNRQWRLSVAATREADRHVDRKFDRQPLHYDTLLAAQRAWLTYRDQHCLGASFEARGGSMAPMLVSGCKAELTRERTNQLKALTETDR